MRRLIFFLLFILPGCLNPQQSMPPLPVEKKAEPEVVEEKRPATKGDVAAVTTSSNVLQTQVQGIGVSLGQLANKVVGIEGDLLKIQNSLEIRASATAVADIKTTLQNTITAVAEVKNDLKLITEINAKLSAFTEIKAKLDAQAQFLTTLEAKINGQAGLSNKIEELKTDVKSGRDSVVVTTQFSTNVMKTIIYGNLFYAGVIIVIVLVIGVVIVILGERSRKRADERYQVERNLRLKGGAG